MSRRKLHSGKTQCQSQCLGKGPWCPAMGRVLMPVKVVQPVDFEP